MMVECRQRQVVFVADLAQQLIAKRRVPLHADKFLIQQAAGVVAHIHGHHALANVVVHAAFIGHHTEFLRVLPHRFHGIVPHGAHHGLRLLPQQPPDKKAGQVGHHQRVDIGRLVGRQHVHQHVFAVGPLRDCLHLHQFPHRVAGHTGILVHRQIVQVAHALAEHFFQPVGVLGLFLRRKRGLIIKQGGEAGQIVVDARRRVVFRVRLFNGLQQHVHHLADRAAPGVVTGHRVKIAQPPVLQPLVVHLVLRLLPVDVLRRFQHLFRDLRVLKIPQVSQQGHPIRVHGILKFIPGDGGVQLAVIGRADDPHGLVEHFHVSFAVGMAVAGHGHPAVAQAPDDIALGLQVKSLVPGHVGGSLLEVSPHLFAQGIDAGIIAPDIHVMHGHAGPVQLPDDGPVVLFQAGVIQQQGVDLIGNAAVLAVGVVEQFARELGKARGFLLRQVFRPAGKDHFVQDGIALLHQRVGLRRVLLDLFQQVGGFHSGVGFRAHEGTDPAQIFNVPRIPFVHSRKSPFCGAEIVCLRCFLNFDKFSQYRILLYPESKMLSIPPI